MACICIPCLMPGTVLDPYRLGAPLCDCVIGATVYFRSLCVHGLGSMSRTEGRRVSHCQQATDREKDGLLFVISMLYHSC